MINVTAYVMYFYILENHAAVIPVMPVIPKLLNTSDAGVTAETSDAGVTYSTSNTSVSCNASSSADGMMFANAHMQPVGYSSLQSNPVLSTQWNPCYPWNPRMPNGYCAVLPPYYPQPQYYMPSLGHHSVFQQPWIQQQPPGFSMGVQVPSHGYDPLANSSTKSDETRENSSDGSSDSVGNRGEFHIPP
jgi:hypothetical protein